MRIRIDTSEGALIAKPNDSTIKVRGQLNCQTCYFLANCLIAKLVAEREEHAEVDALSEFWCNRYLPKEAK